jgi:hypothetical protein
LSDVVLSRLAHLVKDEGGLLAGAVRGVGSREPAYGAQPDYGALAAAGPRAEGHEEEIALVVEAIREGYLLHYGTPRIFALQDGDLALLAGDRLYALGLARLAALADLPAVAELADIIALSAQAQAEGRQDVAEAVWDAGATAIGWGATEALRRAKEAARAGAPDAAAGLLAAARDARGDAPPVR